MIPPVEERQVKGCHCCVFDRDYRCIMYCKQYDKRTYEYQHGRKKDMESICRRIPCSDRFEDIELQELIDQHNHREAVE